MKLLIRILIHEARSFKEINSPNESNDTLRGSDRDSWKAVLITDGDFSKYSPLFLKGLFAHGMSWFFYLCVIHKTKKNHVRLLTQPSVPLCISQPPSIPLSTPPYPSGSLHIPHPPLVSSQPPGYLSAPLSTPPYSSAPLNTSCWQFWKMFIGCDLCFITMNLHLNCFRNINSYQLYYW